MRYIPHTITVRAFSRAGGVRSRSVIAKRVHRVARRASVPFSWALTASSSSTSTVLSGHGAAGGKLAVSLARCSDVGGSVVRRLRLRADGSGTVRRTVGTPGLCVLRLERLGGQ